MSLHLRLQADGVAYPILEILISRHVAQGPARKAVRSSEDVVACNPSAGARLGSALDLVGRSNHVRDCVVGPVARRRHGVPGVVLQQSTACTWEGVPGRRAAVRLGLGCSGSVVSRIARLVLVKEPGLCFRVQVPIGGEAEGAQR